MRIPDNPWKPAMERATREGTTLTAVVVAFLRRYAAGAAMLALVMASFSGSAEASAPVAAVAPMSTSASFVATVRQIGVGTTIMDQTDAYLINGGKSICADFKGGMTRASMWQQASPYYSPRMFDGVVRAAVGAFCPEQSNVL